MAGPQTTPSARFDDLRAGAAFELVEPRDVLVATVPAEVESVLAAAEHAAKAGGWVAGFVGYEAAAGLDARTEPAGWPDGHALTGLPLAWFTVFAGRKDVAPIAAPVHDEPVHWQLDRDEQWHAAAVGAVRADIAAGSYYQLNLTARTSAKVGDIDAVYAAISHAQRGAYNALLRTGEFTIASSSPELFFDVRDGVVHAAPMKGTARRGRWPDEDRLLAQHLRTSPKERAENAMIVDLVRNDLARIAETGSVSVTSLFDLERYPTLWQLTSTVQARPRREVGLVEIFRALFPSGSVTGAPKGSAMAAITRLEQRARGVYCGAVGFLGPGEQARFGVAIRTVTCHEPSGYAEYGAGGAITWSSDPAAEWQELQAKTRVLAAAAHAGALLETMLCEPGSGVRNRDRHLARLGESAGYFGISFDRAAVTAALDDAVAAVRAPARLRLLLDESGSAQVEVRDLDAVPGTVRLGLADDTVDSSDITLFHKAADRTRYTAMRARRPDVDDVVLHNERGELTETTVANLALHIDATWFTPPRQCGLLPGVERARLLDEGLLEECVLTLEHLRSADAIAVFSSLRGWRAATLAD